MISAAPQAVDSSWFTQSRFQVFGHDVSFAGVTAFVVCLALGLAISSLLQHKRTREFLGRLHIDPRLANVITSVLGMVAFVSLLVAGIGAAGIPIPWDKSIPGFGLSPIQVVTLTLWVMIAIWFASASKAFILRRFLSESGLDTSLQYTLSQIIGYVALALGLIIALQNAGINLSALAVFAGAVGVGLGLGLQTVASNFISGLLILAERPIRIGDRITVDGMTGQVQAIRVRATTVLTNDNIALIIPNSRIVGNTITNWSYGSPRVKLHFPLVVSYDSDVDKVCEAMLQAAAEHPAVLKTPAPAAILDGFAENLMNFDLTVWTEEMSHNPQRLRGDLNRAIEKRLRAGKVGKFCANPPVTNTATPPTPAK